MSGCFLMLVVFLGFVGCSLRFMVVWLVCVIVGCLVLLWCSCRCCLGGSLFVVVCL